MSGSYSRLAAIRDYWMPRDPDARAEVRVTDLDEILRKIEPAQEPVAWMYTGIKSDSTEHGPHFVWKPAYMDAMSASKGAQATPLYTTPPQSCKQEALASMYIALCDAIGYSARSDELQSPEEWAAQLYAHYAPLRRPLLTGEEIDALALEVRCDPAALRSAIERELRGEKE